MSEYLHCLMPKLTSVIESNQEALSQATALFAQAIVKDNMIQVLGTGHSHMIGLEGFIRAGVLWQHQRSFGFCVTHKRWRTSWLRHGETARAG